MEAPPYAPTDPELEHDADQTSANRAEAPPDEPAPSDTSTLRPLAEILRELHARIDRKYLKSKKQGGSNITFIPWYRAAKLLERATRGRWEYEVTDRRVIQTMERERKGAPVTEGLAFSITVRITVHGADGSLSREGTGLETMPVVGYGDPQSNAESMALRRAAAKFGLGLHLYEGED